MAETKENTPGKILLQPGTLWTSVKERTQHAIQCGALLSIPTEFEFVEQNGVNFLVRILSNIDRKKAAKKQQNKKTAASGKEFNPFLPYEEDLFVAEISDTHVCIFNKFNVVDHHLLIITRAFEEQESLLTQEDFTAMWACLEDVDGLVFYNSGKIAGASQRHKHLQLVPLPLAPTGLQIPMTPLLTAAKFSPPISAEQPSCIYATIPGLPFIHAFATLEPHWVQSPIIAGELTLERYYTLLRAVGLKTSDPYNLLATREWMLIIPRSQEEYESISINSLGFAGALLVRNQEQMQIVKQQGPMNILKSVAVPIDENNNKININFRS